MNENIFYSEGFNENLGFLDAVELKIDCIVNALGIHPRKYEVVTKFSNPFLICPHFRLEL